MRQTGIIRTIGPTSDPAEIMPALCQAGMNVACISFHGTHGEHGQKMLSFAKLGAFPNLIVHIIPILNAFHRQG